MTSIVSGWGGRRNGGPSSCIGMIPGRPRATWHWDVCGDDSVHPLMLQKRPANVTICVCWANASSRPLWLDALSIEGRHRVRQALVLLPDLVPMWQALWDDHADAHEVGSILISVQDCATWVVPERVDARNLSVG
eukprot:CAMPEP_0181213282 /NCGR_PEP_ID=MMETSP1096-20121128/24817_1 /TAXON_ID=156174 ORGANISM="Chrysochromulina ericina, Strain CCMP281" /NCGR_SAMPLE_ID=MMETSP1096 /ASSEMBLY_ACC=CAM_ASM_000453 /LENGTH=134 /DNA_ID=CAMNT_0023304901 /DNA_START=502 /DNA_END=902 /DNA_ORIENTATION=+